PLQAVPVQDGAAGQDRGRHRGGLAWGPSGSSRAVAALAVVGVRGAVGTGFGEEGTEGADLGQGCGRRRTGQVGGNRKQQAQACRRDQSQPPPHSLQTHDSSDVTGTVAWCAWQESNLLPLAPQASALSGDLQARVRRVQFRRGSIAAVAALNVFKSKLLTTTSAT